MRAGFILNMSNNEQVMLLHGSSGYGVNFDRSNHCWRHTLLNDTSLYNALTIRLSFNWSIKCQKTLRLSLLMDNNLIEGNWGYLNYAANNCFFWSTDIGSTRAWLPSRKSTLHHVGAWVIVLSGHVRFFITMGANAWYLVWVNVDIGIFPVGLQ